MMLCIRCHKNEVPHVGRLCAMCIGTPMETYNVDGLPTSFFDKELFSAVVKSNQDDRVNMEKLMDIERRILPLLLRQPDKWSSLDVNYHPPRVERLFVDIGDGYRLYLHYIHGTDQECLFHKHNWPAALKQVYGSYEMGVAYSAMEIDSDKAHRLPVLAKFIIAPGSYYEMTQTDTLHYVRPITPFSLSIMLTHDKYQEHVIRKEANTRPLEALSDLRKLEILSLFKSHVDQQTISGA